MLLQLLQQYGYDKDVEPVILQQLTNELSHLGNQMFRIFRKPNKLLLVSGFSELILGHFPLASQDMGK